MRKAFFDLLWEKMRENKDIYLLVGDLGFGLADSILKDYPERAMSVGASEQAMMDMAVGLAYEGKVPFVYSITTFLLYRPFETIKLYINGEKLNVKLIGSGRNRDYKHDGPSHWSDDAWKLFDMRDDYGNSPFLDNIQAYWPETIKGMTEYVDNMCKSNEPEFLSLTR